MCVGQYEGVNCDIYFLTLEIFVGGAFSWEVIKGENGCGISVLFITFCQLPLSDVISSVQGGSGTGCRGDPVERVHCSSVYFWLPIIARAGGCLCSWMFACCGDVFFCVEKKTGKRSLDHFFMQTCLGNDEVLT